MKVFGLGSAILVLGLLARLVFLPWPSNTDLDRYVWEGRMVAQGIDPYRYAPDHPRTEPWRDSVWARVNHKEYAAAYGPAAQEIFRLASATKYPHYTLKLLFLLADLGVLLLLLAALRRYHRSLHWAWVYALHPLPLLALVGEGHLEPLLVLPLFGGYLALEAGYRRTGWVLVGLAALVKTPFIVFALFALQGLRLREVVRALPYLLLPALLWLPHLQGFWPHLQTLERFARAEHFHSPLMALLAPWLGIENAKLAAGAVLFGGLATLWVLPGHRLRTVLTGLGLWILCSPIVHPWYAAALLPFAVLLGSTPWWVLATAAPLGLWVTFAYKTTGIWSSPIWMLWALYGPFALAALRQAWVPRHFADPRSTPGHPSRFAAPTSLSVLIPVRNEAHNIADCLARIAVPSGIPAEILVIDGGSTDATTALALEDPRVRLVAGRGGRGPQLAAGYAAASGDLIVIVHADTRLHADTLQRIWTQCATQLGVAGGACTARYAHPAPRFRFTEFLNDARVRWTGIAFGDQVQFFRRAAVPLDQFPDHFLMEDIELSLRIRAAGAVAFLSCAVHASHRRWEKVGYTRNTAEVIAFSALYLMLRSIGGVRDRGARFFRWYYPSSHSCTQSTHAHVTAKGHL